MNKSVLDKLSKFEKNVELAEVKVDLSLATDLQGYSKKLKEANVAVRNAYGTVVSAEAIADNVLKVVSSELPKLISQIKKSTQELESVKSKYKDTVGQSRAVLNRAETSAKELGLDVDDIPNYRSLKDEFNSTFTNQTANINNSTFFTRDLDNKIESIKALFGKL
jgi:predicted transcriptional regulator